MKNSTLDALANFSRNEKELLKSVFPVSKEAEMEPGSHTINNILNYSKAVSFRKSQHISDMCFVLN